MALLDISEVTRALMTLIGQAFDPPSAPTVYPAPPAHLEVTGIGIYMYHLAEDPHYKNLPPPGRDPVPVRFTPMGLNLYYHLSANDEDANDDIKALNEQRMMGIAVKVLRDNPEITVQANNSDNRLRIALTPIPPNEAVSFWTAGNSALKLSAYYEVSVALLEPEESQLRSARVLSYGVHTFVQGAPRIISSESVLTFQIPGVAGTRQVTTIPAQVPSGERFSLVGTGFSGGDLQLLLINANLSSPVVADAPWMVSVVKDKLTAIVQQTAVVLGSNPPQSVPIIPGIYAAQIKVTRTRVMPNGQLRNFTHLSNQSPFAIAPGITSITLLNPAQRLFLIVGFTFEVLPENLRVYILDALLVAGTFNALAEGEYAVDPGDGTRLQLRLPATANSGEDVPLRIFVNEIESEPAWIPVP